MDNERFIWRCGILAERLRNTGYSVALEAARRASRAFAIVADEAAKLAAEIELAVDEARFPPSGAAPLGFLEAVRPAARRLSLLAINAAIESLNSEGGLAIAVSVEAIRAAALELESLCAGERPRHPSRELPSTAKASLASTAREFMLEFSAGGLRFIENFGYLREVMRLEFAAPDIHDGKLRLAGLRHAWPFIDLAGSLGLPRAVRGDGVVLVVKAGWQGGGGGEYAVAVDGLGADAILRLLAGRQVEPKPGPVPPELVRECWDATDGSQFLFLDWPRLAGGGRLS